MSTVTNTEKAPAAIGPYSQAIGFERLLFISGQIPIEPLTGTVAGDDIHSQAEQVMKNISAILEDNRTGFGQVIKTICYLADMKDFGSFNEIYGKYFVSNPARSCVEVKGLPKGVLCEVEVIAYK